MLIIPALASVLPLLLNPVRRLQGRYRIKPTKKRKEDTVKACHPPFPGHTTEFAPLGTCVGPLVLCVIEPVKFQMWYIRHYPLSIRRNVSQVLWERDDIRC